MFDYCSQRNDIVKENVSCVLTEKVVYFSVLQVRCLYDMEDLMGLFLWWNKLEIRVVENDKKSNWIIDDTLDIEQCWWLSI